MLVTTFKYSLMLFVYYVVLYPDDRLVILNLISTKFMLVIYAPLITPLRFPFIEYKSLTPNPVQVNIINEVHERRARVEVSIIVG